MFIYMIYFLTMQIFSFFMVGSFYVSIKLFFYNYFKQLTDSSKFAAKNPELYQFFAGVAPINFPMLFSYFYVVLIIMSVLVSLAVPIDKAINYFRVIAGIFSVFTVASLFGIAAFLIGTGFYPEEMQYNESTKTWESLHKTHFSILTLSGVIMLSVYLLPIVLRPIDFLYNAVNYSLGLVSYILLLPTFINVMQVYSMSNLHDISWGNRPTASAGTNALSGDAKKQQELKANYQVFRVNFLTFWIAANAIFAILVETYAQMPHHEEGKPITVNDGSMGFLEIFAIYLACLVLYRVLFGSLHILKFKMRANCIKRYFVPKFNMHDEVKKLRQITTDWNESLVDSNYNLIENHEDEPDDEMLMDAHDQSMANRSQSKKMEKTYIDSDDDDFEFDDARKEEEQDVRKHDMSAFMVSKANVSRILERTMGGGAPSATNSAMPSHIPNKILDSQFLRESDIEDINLGPRSARKAPPLPHPPKVDPKAGKKEMKDEKKQ